jgi:hypothetical protein
MERRKEMKRQKVKNWELDYETRTLGIKNKDGKMNHSLFGKNLASELQKKRGGLVYNMFEGKLIINQSKNALWQVRYHKTANHTYIVGIDAKSREQALEMAEVFYAKGGQKKIAMKASKELEHHCKGCGTKVKQEGYLCSECSVKAMEYEMMFLGEKK